MNADAYYEGYKAFNNGLNEDACPYRVQRDRRAEWLEGWDAAFFDYEASGQKAYDQMISDSNGA